MSRFWVSWYSGYYADEGCSKPPFQVWLSGERFRRSSERTNATICAVIDAESEALIWPAVKEHFPDYEKRFCCQVGDDWAPLEDRFPGFAGLTSPCEGAR